MAPDSARAAKRAPTARQTQMSSGLSVDETKNASEVMVDRTDGMVSRAAAGEPFTAEELDGVINSLRNIAPRDSKIDWDELRSLLAEIAHISHKQWEVTGKNSTRMAAVMTPSGMSPDARQIFERILHEGNWDGAVTHAGAADRGAENPWAVLVTGVNGIRKTTAMYQPWFSRVLAEALVVPLGGKDFPLGALPDGENSFFRQLDHMITTLTNEEFTKLYALTGAQLGDSGEDPPKEIIQRYSNYKAGLFTRYRTLSELLGVLLLREAQNVNINAMCETSGRDVAMFHYIDSFFPASKYNKLALHFTVNDLTQAMHSVDARMVREIKTGQEALGTNDPVEVIYANAGGPYGSEVLAGVQADSDRVWDDVVMKGDTVGKDWYKATISINAHPTEPWTVQAVKPDGSLGTVYTFGPPRTVG